MGRHAAPLRRHDSVRAHRRSVCTGRDGSARGTACAAPHSGQPLHQRQVHRRRCWATAVWGQSAVGDKRQVWLAAQPAALGHPALHQGVLERPHLVVLSLPAHLIQPHPASRPRLPGRCLMLPLFICVYFTPLICLTRPRSASCPIRFHANSKRSSATHARNTCITAVCATPLHPDNVGAKLASYSSFVLRQGRIRRKSFCGKRLFRWQMLSTAAVAA
mmetsp:Transcript_6770/g.11640  ORF Transcript_6770/g.11640 Transcript_6770/m.11640 type:complete len:218 (+) Transcript_6770:1421-2074(+)